MKIKVILSPGIQASQDEYEFEADCVTESIDGFLDVVRFTDEEEEILAMFNKSGVIAVDLGGTL